jgi:hypothetical protein
MAEAPQKIKKSGRPQGLPLHKTQPRGRMKDQLLDVFPVRGIQTPSNESKKGQENQNPDTDLNPCILTRFGHPLHVSHQITDRLIVL